MTRSREDGPSTPSPEVRRVAPFALILAVSVLDSTAVYAVRPMISYRALQLGAGPFELGVLASSYALLALFAAFLIGRATDRYGSAPFMVAGASLLALASFGTIWIGSVVGLVMAQAVLGLGQIMNLVGTQTLVANQTARQRRDERFGLYTMVASGGQLVGPAMAGLLTGYVSPSQNGAALDLTPVFLLAVGVALAAAVASGVIALLSGPPPARVPEAEHRGNLGTAWTILRKPSIPQAMLASLSVVLSMDLLVAYLPAIGEANGLSVEVVGLLLSVRAAGSMVSRLFMGTLIRRLGRGALLAGSLLVAGIGIAALPFLAEPAVLFLLLAMLGLGLGLGQPMSIAWISNRVARQERGTALGVRLTGSRLGQLVLPSVMGSIAGAAGLATMFGALAGILFLASGLVWRSDFDDLDGRT